MHSAGPVRTVLARRRPERQSGQVLVIVAVWLVALIASAALILLTGSVEWQRNQLQQIADQAALDAALKIGVGCTGASSSTVITEADNLIATQRSRTGSLSISGASCAGGYTGTDIFSTSVTATIHYPYRSHQQQVEVILTEALPISFGNYLGATNTNVTRRAVAQQLNGSTAAVTASTLSCTGGQFNVAGGIVASNTISLSGGCAVYAHDRFDATSSTYSDLGNTSVYANGQTWVGGGGVCVAGASSGSSNSVCADGFELSGHSAMTCGTSGTSEYLAAGNPAINPNPCAAGAGSQPVPQVAINLPPEPNADPTITATLPGGVACNSGASYSNILVNGVTVGTGNAAAPTTDASGYVHFKTGCYGFLNVGNLGSSGSITSRQIGLEDSQSDNKVVPTLPAPSAVGTLLVVTLHAQDGMNTISGPAGWVLAASAQQAGEGWNEIWYLPGTSNPGGLTSAQWKATPGSLDVSAQMTEWNGAVAAAPLDRTGTTTVAGTSLTATVGTSAATTTANELVITSDGFNSPAGQTFTQGATYAPLINDPGFGYGSEYRTNAAIGVQSETVGAGQATQWSLAIATFIPAGTVSPPGAVLDPGFYYFNGSGFVGGGGLCLTGGTLLARDVTLEFVNQAGLSTGTCAAGGAGGCAVLTCQFGSTPCSISACPPNAVADSTGGGFTWFAAPCSSAPAGDASCAGSTWCPVGDRACWNLLIWAPSTVSGQIAIVGASAKHWLLGSIFFPGTCTDRVTGSSTLDGTITCGTLSVSAAAGAGTAVGSDYGVSTALVEAVLVE
ncbi:MAG TPA: pilus assembly protein TadG-related protein [Candidatus Dormibacteraeota bacterium]|nr:pilus assembly protein TadG-related protein [Candidatus Dormibacteraeota bacterium]